MRKTFTLLIALLMLSISTWADGSQEQQIDGLLYQLNVYGGGSFKQAYVLRDASYSSLSGDLVIPGTVTYDAITYEVMGIMDNAFESCYGITTLTIEEGVRDVNQQAFLDCSGLTQVTLPSTIQSLGNQAFDYSGVATITINATTPPTLGDNVFTHASSLAHIYVPAASVATYQAASGWSTYASIIDAIPAAPSSSTVVWDDAILSSFYLIELNMGGYPYTGNTTKTVNNVTATVSATADGSDAEFKHEDNAYGTQISISGGGTLTFSTTVGQFVNIVINTTESWTYVEDASTGWDSSSPNKLTWSGSATNSVVLGTATVQNITSIEFTLDNGGSAPTGQTITWGEQQLGNIRFDGNSQNYPKSTGVIKNIIATHERTGDGYTYFYGDGGKQLYIDNNGYIKFTSIVGNITNIVITCSALDGASDLPAGWTALTTAQKLTWTGDAEEVTLSGNVLVTISSIEFTYTPAPAPRLGEQIEYAYQLFEITGAHTAKVPVQEFGGSFEIPAYLEDLGVRYYITEIDDNAFKNQTDLAYIIGGDNIARIGDHAFEGCIHMYAFMLNGGVLEEIGEAALKDCKLLAYFTTNTMVPPVLGANAFEGDILINHILVSYFGVDAYKAAAGWSAYASIISEGGTDASVGEQFFHYVQMSRGWYEVTVPATYGNTGQAKVLPYNSYVNTFYPITYKGTLVIPEEASYMGRAYDITGIGANAYKDSTRIKAVLLPQKVTSIESGAFLNCTGIENVYFLWDDPTLINWADRNVGAEFATAASGETKIIVPKDRLNEYKAWAPAWASCMIAGELLDIDVKANEDPNHIGRYYRSFFDSENDYLLPPSVWAHAGYVSGEQLFILANIAFDGQILPKNTAVILESETPSYRLIKVNSSASPSPALRAPKYTGPNDLRGTDVDIDVSSLGADADNVYVLGKAAMIAGTRQEGMGMYKYDGTTLGAHKAYLVYNAPSGPNSAPARFVFKHENETTGVENAQGKVQCIKILRDGQLVIIRDNKEYNAQGIIIK